MDWLVSALLFIVALGTLICLHELGHFSMAKLFNVYCHEFSIGFGPAILHKRRKGKETYFSIRAIPLGGYVSMYGEEDGELEPGLKLTQDRSIEGIKKWKKAIVVSAGVVVNALLAIAIFAVSNLCFPEVNTVNSINQNNSTLIEGIQENDRLTFIGYINPNAEVTAKVENNFIDPGFFYTIDNDVVLEGKEDHYVLGFHVYSEKECNSLSKGLSLCVGIKNTESEEYKDWTTTTGATEFYIPDLSQEYHGDISFTANFRFLRDGEEISKLVELTIKDQKFNELGINLKLDKTFAPFEERFKGIWIDFGTSATAVVNGLITLFKPQGIKQMSGIVGIFVVSKDVYSTRTFAYYLYMWGMISVNLAIFNLLPFPGLDGWQLLVTVVEGITKKKISTKFKSIMNLIGFGLLIILMGAILVVDIARLV